MLVCPSRGTAGDDRDPHVERRVHRPLARGTPRRRLRRLVGARDRARRIALDRDACGASDRRLRRRAGADRGVRDPGRRRSTRRGPDAARGAHSRRLARALDHPAGLDDPPGRRRRDQRGRPDRGDRLPRRRPCLGRAARPRREASSRTWSSSAAAGRHGDRAHAGRAGDRRAADRAACSSAPARRRSCPKCASTTPPASISTSSSGSGSGTRRPRSSP